MGSLNDKEIIADQAYHSDIVIHSASADHLPNVQGVLAGIKKRAAEGKSTIYIHTSGTGLPEDGAKGEYKSEKVYQDDKLEDIHALPDSAPHREIDLAILKVRKELQTKAKIAIILPPVIYGHNPKHGHHSIQMPRLARSALKHGYAGHVEKGKSVWGQIHVFDLVRGYTALLDWLERSTAEEVLVNPYFFCENGIEFSWGEGAAEIGKLLHAAERIETAEPRRIPEEGYDDLFGRVSTRVVGFNSRFRANRLRGMGWAPQEKSMFESLAEDEIPGLLKETGEFKGYGRRAA